MYWSEWKRIDKSYSRLDSQDTYQSIKCIKHYDCPQSLYKISKIKLNPFVNFKTDLNLKELWNILYYSVSILKSLKDESKNNVVRQASRTLMNYISIQEISSTENLNKNPFYLKATNYSDNSMRNKGNIEKKMVINNESF